jgi:Holliday junction DNA helicase RuvA
MIAYLRGKIILKQAPIIILDINGVGYELFVPMSTYYNLPEINASQNEVELFCYQYIREDANVLYGFSDLNQRKLFTALIKLNGVGPRLALTILSNYQVTEFINVINRNDITALTRLPGVGNKTAERLLLELKDKLKNLFNQDEMSKIRLKQTEQSGVDMLTDSTDFIVADAIAALETLGYKYNDAQKVINRLAVSGTHTSETLIKAALKEFK